MQEQVYTMGQIAAMCRVAPRTVTKWFDSNRLKGYRLPSGDRRVTKEDLQNFLREWNIPIKMIDEEFQEQLDPLTIARNATKLLQQQGGDKYIGLLAGMMKTCCTKCNIHGTCEFAYDPYNVNCEPKIDCLAAK